MERRKFALVTLAALASPRRILAQPVKKVARIGYLSSLSVETGKPGMALFREGMRGLGYVEGKNLVIDERHVAGQFDRLPGMAAELLRLKPDVFLVYGAEAAHAARSASGTVPIVLANTQDPIASGLVTSLARPGGNITGLSDFHAASVTKRLELLKEAVPALSRVAVFWRAGHAAHPPSIRDLRAAAPVLGITVVPLEVKGLDDIERAFVAMRKERAGALLLLGDALLTTHMARIAELALQNRLPSMYTTRTFIHAGGLMGYGTNIPEMFRRSATYVDRILKGAKPGDLPIEQPTKFELTFNLKTAKALGITIPRSLLVRADEVIE
ncbi:MAG: ABC transporter substrate-binding protein [Dongiaceae bacterium]